MRLDPHKTARENAVLFLPRLAGEYFQAGDKAAGPGHPVKRLHPFRIQTKRFRYSLEYFRPCYGPAMDSYLAQVKGLQQSLGELNDCFSSRGYYQRLLRINEPQQRRLLAALHRREGELREKFRYHWQVGFARPQLRQRLLRYLAKPPGRKGAKPGATRTA